VVLLRYRVFSLAKTSVGIAPAGDGGKVKSQSSTRVVVERCFRVFSCARIVAPCEMFDRSRIHLSQSVGDPGARGCIAGIDNHFAIRSGKDGDVSAGADKCTHISAQGLNSDVSGLRTFACRKDDVFTFGEETPWREPGSRGQDSGGGDEPPARKALSVVALFRAVCHRGRER
jgi:hypothetical protein